MLLLVNLIRETMKQLVLTIIAAAIAGPAFAGNAYIGGSAGRAEQTLSVEGMSLSETDSGAKVVVGYQVNPAFGVEAGYAVLGKTKVGGNGAWIGAEPKSVYAAVTGTMPLSPVLTGFVKVGAAHTETKMYATDRYDSFSFDEKDTSLVAGVGALFALSTQVSLVAEYEHFGKIAKFPNGGNLKADLLSVGVRFQF
jgi:OOP family OmpA-OmpF porin